MNLEEIRRNYIRNYVYDPCDPSVYLFYDRPILYRFSYDNKLFLAQLITDNELLEETLVVEVSQETLDLYENGGLLIYDLYRNSENDLIVFREIRKADRTDQPHLEIKFYTGSTIPSDYLPSKNSDLGANDKNHAYIWIDFETEGLELDKHLPLSLAYVATDSYGHVLQKGRQSFIKNPTYNCSPEAFKVHKLTKEYLDKVGKPPHEVVEEFNAYLDDIYNLKLRDEEPKECQFILAGQSVYSFDKPMLEKLCTLGGNPKVMERFSRRIMEMESVSMFLFNGQNPGLDSMLKKFQLSRPKKHDALEDVMATVNLFKKYMEMV